MKERIFFPIAAISMVAFLTIPANALAADSIEQVALCAAAADAQGVASAADFRPKFLKTKGGAVKTVTVKFVPVADGDAIEAECQIRRGEVVNVAVKA